MPMYVFELHGNTKRSVHVVRAAHLGQARELMTAWAEAKAKRRQQDYKEVKAYRLSGSMSGSKKPDVLMSLVV